MSGTTCIQMYLMKVRLFQHPISCIILTSTPARNMAMAAPDLMECVHTLSATYADSQPAPPDRRDCQSEVLEDVFDVIPVRPALSSRGKALIIVSFQSAVVVAGYPRMRPIISPRAARTGHSSSSPRLRFLCWVMVVPSSLFFCFWNVIDTASAFRISSV